MLEVDEGGGDQQRNEHPISDRHVPLEREPHGEEHQRRDQLNGEVAKRDAAAAIRAFAAQEKPADERQILVPRDLFLARRTEGALRLVHRQIERQPVDDDVQERADHRAQDKRDDAKEQLVGSGRHRQARAALRCISQAIQMQLS
jgi:hypothetical protein